MKYPKVLIILSILITGLLFITADTYAEDDMPKYIKGERSSGHSLPKDVARKALMARYDKYMEAVQAGQEPEGQLEYDGFDIDEIRDNDREISDDLMNELMPTEDEVGSDTLPGIGGCDEGDDCGEEEQAPLPEW